MFYEYDWRGNISAVKDGNDNDSEKPYYIGITNDLERRAQEHKETGRLDPKKSSLRPLDVDITYGEARGYEQC